MREGLCNFLFSATQYPHALIRPLNASTAESSVRANTGLPPVSLGLNVRALEADRSHRVHGVKWIEIIDPAKSPGTNEEETSSMKKIILAAALVVVGATSASAQFARSPWRQGEHPYAERRHKACQDKAWRLREFDRRAAADGRVSPRERRIHDALRADLDRTCGGFRWRS
jgi:hypothetical protein